MPLGDNLNAQHVSINSNSTKSVPLTPPPSPAPPAPPAPPTALFDTISMGKLLLLLVLVLRLPHSIQTCVRLPQSRPQL